MEYFLDLRDCYCYGNRNNNTDAGTLLVGDVVLVHWEDHPRGFWQLARKEELKMETNV